MRLKTIIAIPPIYDFYFTPHRFSILGAEILFTLLTENNCKSEILNFPVERKKGNTMPLPEELSYLKPHLLKNEKGPLSFFSQYRRFGPDVSECATRIVFKNPDLVFISCFAFCYAKPALEIAQELKKLKKDIIIIIGGAGASAYPEFFIKHPFINFVIVGEAEVSIPAFISKIRSAFHLRKSKILKSVPNLYQKIGRKIIPPEIITQTSPEEIKFLFKKMDETRHRVYFTTSLSRGCPKQCRFCSNFLCHGKKFRTTPIESVKKAIRIFSETHKGQTKKIIINFEDDNLLSDKTYFLKILETLKAGCPSIQFLAENGIDYTLLTPGLVKRLVSLGMRHFNLSLASIDSRILNSEKRFIKLHLYEQIIKTLHDLNISSNTYFICGLKGENRKTVVSNLVFLAGQPTRLGISLFYPVPGIKGFENKKYFDKISPGLCAGSSAFAWNQYPGHDFLYNVPTRNKPVSSDCQKAGNLNTSSLVTAFRISRFINLCKISSKSGFEKSLVQKIINEKKLFTISKKNKDLKIIPVPYVDNKMVSLFFKQFDKFSPSLKN